MQNLEFKSSKIYDCLHENLDNIFQKIKDGVKETAEENNKNISIYNSNKGISLGDLLNQLEEINLYNNTNFLIIKNISCEVYEDKLNKILNKVIKAKNMLNKENSNSDIIDKKYLNKEKNPLNLLSIKIKNFFVDLNSDLNSLFKKYNIIASSISLKYSQTIFKFILTEFSKLTNTSEIPLENEFYSIKEKSYDLISDQPLNNNVHKWKIIFDKTRSFSCVGFGLGSLDDTELQKISISKNQNNVLLCLCCNGPWSAKPMTIVETNYKFKNKLYNANKKEVNFEINREEGKFKILDFENQVHSEYLLSLLPYQYNLVPVMYSSSGVSFNFKIEVL